LRKKKNKKTVGPFATKGPSITLLYTINTKWNDSIYLSPENILWKRVCDGTAGRFKFKTPKSFFSN
jgi:hypothetical protein